METDCETETVSKLRYIGEEFKVLQKIRDKSRVNNPDDKQPTAPEQNGLIEAGKIKNDGWKEVEGWSEEFRVDKNNPRIEVEIFKIRGDGQNDQRRNEQKN